MIKFNQERRKNELIEGLVLAVHNLLFNGLIDLEKSSEAVIAIDYMYNTDWASYYFYSDAKEN